MTGVAVDGSPLKFVDEYLAESAQALQLFLDDDVARAKIVKIADRIAGALSDGRKIMLAGNGGSAADAQHIAGEFLSRLFLERTPLPAVALTTDTSVLTAVANDYGYEHVFERQVMGLGNPGDVFLGLSTSGKSANVLRAFQAARARGVITVGFTGSSGGSMHALCDELFHAPSDKTSIVQQIHIVAGHLICGLVERQIFGETSPDKSAK